MDKITKEELMKKLNLTEEELDKITGGSEPIIDWECFDNCHLRNVRSTEYCYEKCYKQSPNF